MKLRILSICICFFVLVSSFSSFADISETESVKSWQEAVDDVVSSRIASQSEADEILFFDDDSFEVVSYDILPLSSVGIVTNTVDRTAIYLDIYNIDRSQVMHTYINSSGELAPVSVDWDIGSIDFVFRSPALPSTGTYNFSCDFSSVFSFEKNNFYFYAREEYTNVQSEIAFSDLPDSYLTFSSGDFYVKPFPVSVSKSGFFVFGFYVSPDSHLRNLDGSIRFNFAKTDLSPVFSSPGTSNSDIEASYQQGVTSGLSYIGDTLEEIVETISMQIEALWNQMYNYMHLPQYEKLEQIRQAIENLDLNIDVDQSELISKIQEQIENDNSNTDRLINSYDNSSLTQANDDLNQSIDDYDSQEQEVMDQVSGYVSDFEYESYFAKFTAPIADISYFLTGIYEGLAGLNIPIGFSLTLMIALICIGFYRFKGGG